MKRAYRISLGTAATLLLVAFGCGGVGGADGLFNTGNGGSAGSASGQMPASSNAGSTSGSNTASTSSASSGGGGATASSSSGDSSSSSTASSSASSSSSSSGGGPTLPCGTVMCPLGNMNACCWDVVQMKTMCVQGSPQTDNCNTDPMPGGYQTRVECHAPSDCPGGVCCGHLNQNTNPIYYDNVTCQPNCDVFNSYF